MTRRFAAVLAAHWVIAQLCPSPWWAPNLTVAALILWVGRWPSRWWLFALCAGWWMMWGTVRDPRMVWLACVLIAVAVRFVVRQLEWSDPYLPEMCVGASTAALSVGALWSEHILSPVAMAFALLHVLLTTLSVPLLRRLTA